LAAIHHELFAGRTYEARLLFEAASRVPHFLARRCIAKMQLELYRLHPGKFTGGRLEKTAMSYATRRVWQGLGIILLLGLGTWLFPMARGAFIGLGVGIASGVFLRVVNWKEGYHRMGLILWLARWFFLLIIFLIIFPQLVFLVHPLRQPGDSHNQPPTASGALL